ncbi:uncharacterized protein A1O9_03760, partial [Exophiala aquamarina CBS 119918]
ARKETIEGACILSFIGAAISAGAERLWRLVLGKVLQGIGVSISSIVYPVPAILPRKWRPMAQASIVARAALSCMVVPLSLGGLKRDAHTGWRNWFVRLPSYLVGFLLGFDADLVPWFQPALWGASTITFIVGYRPPMRHTRYDNYSVLKKIATLDL